MGWVFTESAPSAIQYISSNFYGMLFVPSIGDRSTESWRLLVKGRIAKIAKLSPLPNHWEGMVFVLGAFFLVPYSRIPQAHCALYIVNEIMLTCTFPF